MSTFTKSRRAALGFGSAKNISKDKITIAVYAKEMSYRTGELRAVENTVA